MNSSERKDKLLKLIEESTKPIKGNELAEKLNVSRQIIVQDIALIRATGKDIVATPQGYMIYNQNNKIEKKIKCKNHKNNEELFDELKSIIDKIKPDKVVVSRIDNEIFKNKIGISHEELQKISKEILK